MLIMKFAIDCFKTPYAIYFCNLEHLQLIKCRKLFYLQSDDKLHKINYFHQMFLCFEKMSDICTPI